jgi:hypothetical protein
MSSNISIVSEIGRCSEFINEDGTVEEISVVISPLKVIINKDSTKMQVMTGCNMWKACYNKKCHYSGGK